jgi:hypothetical protein
MTASAKSFVILLIFLAAAKLIAQTPVNGYARVSSIAGSTLTVTNVSETYDTFEDGEYVIVMQVQDNNLGNTTSTPNFGNMTATPVSAGLYEVALIASHTEVALLPNTITLTSALANTYNNGTNSRVQIISYPVFGSPNYTSPAAGINGLAWDGNCGGVIAFWVTGTLTLGGNITADGLGLRGGSKNTPNGYSACDGITYAVALGQRYAGKGEGIYLNTNAAQTGGRGKMLNGGGGGNDVNAGGGGGGNFSSGGDGGSGWVPAGTGCAPGVGGLGGIALNAWISGARLFMGGGGGGGHENDGVGTAGGNGGGIILIRATTISTGGSCTRSITANGITPPNAVNDGSGGGGAGGSILLQVTSYSIVAGCPLTVSANGGNGANSNTSGTHGGGGGGGEGAVVFSGAQPSTNVTTQTNAGVGGFSCIGCTSPQNGNNGNGPNNSGIITGNPNPLPVELLSFTGNQNGYHADLYWQTATEINNDYFVVERRDAVGNMNELGVVDGAGNSSQILNYTLTDFAPNAGINYYRLRQVDYNGTTAYSQWISVNFEVADHYISVFPNPTVGNFDVSLMGYSDQLVTATITDVTGRIVSEQTLAVLSDSEKFNLDLSGESFGIYFLSLVSGVNSETIRIVRF